MRQIILQRNNLTVSFYDDIHEMPQRKLNAFQIAIVQDAGMGSKIEDIDVRLAKYDTFYAAGRVREALQERHNLRLGMFFMLEGIDTGSLCLAHLVHSINGERVQDVTETDILAIAKQLESGDITYNQIHELKEEIKKKLIVKLNYISPN